MRHAIASAALVCALGSLAAGQEPPTPTPSPATPSPAPPASQPTSKPASPAGPKLPALGRPAGRYGAPLRLQRPIPLAEAAAKVRTLHGRPILVHGLMKDVCRKKGCWMVLAEGEREVRVRFKDYSFFVPRDSSGREVLVEGILTEKTISEEIAKHYAEEGGDPEQAKQIKGPQKILAFTATGVEILGKRSLPPRAEASAEASRAALAARLEAGRALGRGPATPDARRALALLRSLQGPRSEEFSVYTELKHQGATWFVFSSSERAFERGYAVKDDGTVMAF